ncbi:hydroxyacylglutathione hydrolase, partial [Acinetobacter nectaris]|nr:hydroxyacylglutathione hydrolase [Acinetobacter nectaris]MCF9026808.1 hydroxyacylglutathione hydrolase [Acinetobacter nectaris]
MTHFKIHVIDVENSLQNYIWLLEDTKTHEVVVVDPTKGEIVIEYCK